MAWENPADKYGQQRRTGRDPEGSVSKQSNGGVSRVSDPQREISGNGKFRGDSAYENAKLLSVTSGRSFGFVPRFAGLFPSGRPVRVAVRIRRCDASSVHPNSNIRFQFSPIWLSRNAL